jgi:hypothetical protein
VSFVPGKIGDAGSTRATGGSLMLVTTPTVEIDNLQRERKLGDRGQDLGAVPITVGFIGAYLKMLPNIQTSFHFSSTTSELICLSLACCSWARA